MKAITGELKCVFIVEDIDKKKIRKVAKKTCAERIKIRLLKDAKIRKQIKEKVNKLVDVGSPNLWGVIEEVMESCEGKR